MTVNPFILTPEERLRAWRDFKKVLTDEKTDYQQLKLVADWWSQCPITKKYIDWSNLDEWPKNPWEFIYHNDICQSGVAYCMEQTLLSADSRWQPNRLDLVFIDDGGYDTYLILVIDNHYVLNYNQNTVDTLDSLQSDVQFIHHFQNRIQ